MGKDGDDSYSWRDYEDHIFERLKEFAGKDGTVEFDQSLLGRFSGTNRQVDVLVTGHFQGVTNREMTAAVDCKYYSRRIDVKKVDEFIGFIDDVNADIGILITNSGFTVAAEARAKGGRAIDLQVVVADVDGLPPAYQSSWDDNYYESEYVEGAPYGPNSTSIFHSYIDPAALEFSFDPEHPPERLTESVLAGSDDEISWNDDTGRARCMRAILEHRHDELVSTDDVKLAVRELAYHWRDGYPWVLYDAQLAQLGL